MPKVAKNSAKIAVPICFSLAKAKTETTNGKRNVLL